MNNWNYGDIQRHLTNQQVNNTQQQEPKPAEEVIDFGLTLKEGEEVRNALLRSSNLNVWAKDGLNKLIKKCDAIRLAKYDAQEVANNG